MSKTLRTRTSMAAAAMAAMALCTMQARADVRLLAAAPAPDASTASPQTILLRFSEGIVKNLSSVTLTDGSGHAVAVMQMPAANATALSIMPDSKLLPGPYTVSWTVVSADGHNAKGSYHFTVK